MSNVTQPGRDTVHPRATAPLVTALVPTYNGAAFIGRTLDSLAAQTWPNLEILIGDDCSTDETLEVVTAFAADRDDTRVIGREANLGWLRNTNDLMSRASGEFLFFAFHDDVVAPTYVERLARALLDRTDAVLAFSDMTVVERDGTERTHVFDRLATVTSTVGRGLVMARRPENWWVPNRGLFRSSAYQRVGGIHPNASGEYSADWTWLLHLALLGPFVRVPGVLCRKFYLKDSLSKRWPHVAAQRADLLKAGLDEVRRSSIGPLQKLAVMGVLVPTSVGTRARAVAKRIVKRS